MKNSIKLQKKIDNLKLKLRIYLKDIEISESDQSAYTWSNSNAKAKTIIGLCSNCDYDVKFGYCFGYNAGCHPANCDYDSYWVIKCPKCDINYYGCDYIGNISDKQWKQANKILYANKKESKINNKIEELELELNQLIIKSIIPLLNNLQSITNLNFTYYYSNNNRRFNYQSNFFNGTTPVNIGLYKHLEATLLKYHEPV